MDAKRLGAFIAERRKELGLTQALLAEQLYVTDKAISRWERGIGLPDISNIEALAVALDVSLVELLQAQRNDSDNLSTKEAEKLLIDTIQLSQGPHKFAKRIGSLVLAVFVMVAIMLLCLLLADWKIVIFPVVSIITGLIACAVPIWQISIAQTSRTVAAALSSFALALVSLMIQFMSIANKVHLGDMAAVEDTIDGLVIVIFIFITLTLLLNIMMAKFSKHR